MQFGVPIAELFQRGHRSQHIFAVGTGLAVALPDEMHLLVDRQEQFAQTVSFVHAEVYTDSTAKTPTEAVQTYGLEWEPSLFLAMPDGTIASRLDYTFDATELDTELSRLVQ